MVMIASLMLLIFTTPQSRDADALCEISFDVSLRWMIIRLFRLDIYFDD